MAIRYVSLRESREEARKAKAPKRATPKASADKAASKETNPSGGETASKPEEG